MCLHKRAQSDNSIPLVSLRDFSYFTHRLNDKVNRENTRRSRTRTTHTWELDALWTFENVLSTIPGSVKFGRVSKKHNERRRI